MVTTVPEGTSPVKVDELRAAEAVRAAELAKQGHLVRILRRPLGPGEWRSVALFRATDETEIHEVLGSLPLHIWMKVTITPLTPHPDDPVQAIVHNGKSIQRIPATRSRYHSRC